MIENKATVPELTGTVALYFLFFAFKRQGSQTGIDL